MPDVYGPAPAGPGDVIALYQHVVRLALPQHPRQGRAKVPVLVAPWGSALSVIPGSPPCRTGGLSGELLSRARLHDLRHQARRAGSGIQGWTNGPSRATFRVRLTNQPGVFGVPGSRSSPSEALRPLPSNPGRCLPGGPVRVSPPHDAPRRTRPVWRCPRAPRGPLNRLPAGPVARGVDPRRNGRPAVAAGGAA